MYNCKVELPPILTDFQYILSLQPYQIKNWKLKVHWKVGKLES